MAKKPNAAATADDQKKTAASDDNASGPAPDAAAEAVTGDTAAGAGAEGTAAVADTSAPAAAEGAAVAQQTTLVVEAAAPAKPDAEPRPERRSATVASWIDHDGENYRPDDLILLTEAEFRGLARSGALIETSWEDCPHED